MRAVTAIGRGVDFDAIYAGHVARVVRLAALLGSDDPEDVAQEAFCRLYVALPRVREPELPAYLNRIVVNEVRSRARRRRTARGKQHLLSVVPVVAGPTGERSAVLAEVARLPRRQREAVVLRYWLDLTFDQIGAAMGVATGTAKSQVSRALRTLAAALDEEEA